jgi:hypothetical protein
VAAEFVSIAACWCSSTVPVLFSVVSHRKLASVDRWPVRMGTTGLQWLGVLLSVTLGSVFRLVHTDSTNYLLGRESNE